MFCLVFSWLSTVRILRKAFGLLLAAVALVSSIALPIGYLQIVTQKGPPKDFFFGVTFGGNTTAEAERLIERVKDYTNLFVVDSWDIATNEYWTG